MSYLQVELLNVVRSCATSATLLAAVSFAAFWRPWSMGSQLHVRIFALQTQ